MKNVLDMCKNIIGIGPSEQDEMDSDYEAYEGRGTFSENRRSSEEYEDRPLKKTFSKTSNLVTLSPELKDMKVVVLSPTKYDEARAICDNLKACAPVIVKLDKLDREEAQRVIDFICGACYTMDGNIQEIKEDVFLIAPSVISIEESDEQEAVKNPSFFSKFARY